MSSSTDTVHPYSAPAGGVRGVRGVRVVLAVLVTVVSLAVLAVATGTFDTFRQSRPTTTQVTAPPTDATDMPMPEWLEGYLALGDGAFGSPKAPATRPVNEGLR